MRPWTFIAGLAVICSLLVVLYAPRQDHQSEDQQVQPCGENAGWIEPRPGHVVCTLKNGQVINLRSAK